MSLVEGLRRVYGIQAQAPGKDDDSSMGSVLFGNWYDKSWGKSWDDRIRRAKSAARRSEAYTPNPNIKSFNPLPDPAQMMRGAQGAQAISRLPGPGDRGERRGSSSYGPGFSKAQKDFYIQAGQQQGFGGPELSDTGLPAYTATSSAPGSYQMAQQARQEAEGLYNEGHLAAITSWSTERIAQKQRELVKAGLLTSKFRLGIVDAQTKEAYGALLALANDNGGKTENEMMAQLKSTSQQDLADFFRKPAYVAPDRAALIDDVESVFAARLGRAPNSDERRELADFYAKQFRKEYQLETIPMAQEQAMSAFAQGGGVTDAEVQLAGGDPYAAAGLGAAPDVTDVDPNKRFANFFRERYRDEEAELGRRKDRAEMEATAIQGFEQLRTMMGAGGVQQLGS